MFDSEFMKKLEYLSLVSRRIFRGQLLAQKRTKQLGGGVEFADHRDYALGDDLRYLDWNIFARFKNRLIKRFEEEEDLHIYFFLDCSRSMNSGNPNKFDYARKITAALAYIALSDLDRVCLVAFDSQIREIFPLIRGKQRILSVLRFLERCETGGKTTDLLGAARDFVHRKQHTGLVVIVSDFFDPGGFQNGVDALRLRGYEPNLIQVHDPLEAEPRFRGDMQLFDMESGTTRDATISETLLQRYKSVFADFLDEIKRYCIGRGLRCTISPSTVPFDELILQMMRKSSAVN